MNRTQIIILNGVSSVGKSSVAHALQAITREPFLHVAMDAFFAMLPPALLNGHPDGLVFETISEHGKPATNIIAGPVVERAMQGMRHAVAAMAAQGNHLIVDIVMMEQAPRLYWRLLEAYAVHFVGLFADLNVIEARERQRGNRTLGLARWQQDRLHRDMVYDLTLDTTMTSPLENAKKIQMFFNL